VAKFLKHNTNLKELLFYCDGIYFAILLKTRSRASFVGTVARLRAGQAGVRIPEGARYNSLPKIVQTGSGVHPTYY
jgi:hypothetical protein